jgi:GNAT superfamily N-acetyltransferase
LIFTHGIALQESVGRDYSRNCFDPLIPVTSLAGDSLPSARPRTRYYRFCGGVREYPEKALARFVHADGERAVTLLARADDEQIVGLGEYVAQQETGSCEIALVVHDAWQREGIGSLLPTGLMRRAREASLRYMEGLVLRGNDAMLKLVRARGFEVDSNPLDPAMLRVRTTLGVAPMLSAPSNRH